MGQINLGGRGYGEYQAWLQSPEGQRAAQAENARVQAQGGPRYSHDGMVQPPPGWAQGQSHGPPAGFGGDRAAFQTPKGAKQQGYSGPLTQMGGQFVAQEPAGYGGYMNQQRAAPSGLLAHDAPWWAGEFGHLPHDPSDRRPAYDNGRPTGAGPENYGGGAKRVPQPGAAQPKQPQSQGAPYGAWTGTQVTNQAPTQIQGGGVGNFAYSPQDRRPQPFTQNTSFGGMSGNAQDVFRQRDAFVQSINNSRSQHAAQWGQGQRRPPPRNFGQMMGQAQGMVRGGWQNPLQGLFGGAGSPSGRLRKGATAADAGPPPPGAWY